MKKTVKRLLLLAVFVLMFGMAGCGSTLTTNLSVSDNFAGSRTMDISIDKDTFDEYAPAGGFKELALKTKEKAPECMQFTYEEKDGDYVFHFVMSFTSKEEYEQQVSAVLGKEYDVEFVYSKSPFSNEVSLQEDFSSEDLLLWFKEYLIETEYVEKEDAPYIFKTVKNVITVNGTKYDCKKNCLSLSKKSYIPIEEMNIFTDIDTENEKIARKIEIIFDDYVLSTNREVIEKYLISVTPEGSMGEWKTEEDYEKFILVIPSSTEEEMTAAMQTFCSSENSEVKLSLFGEEEEETLDEKEEEPSYSDVWDEQVLGDIGSKKKTDSQVYVQPFGFETTISENLDLNAFVCDSWGEIESSYYISIKNGKPESMVYYPGEKESYGWDYIEAEYPDYYYIENSWMPTYQVVSNVNKYYVPSSVKMNTTVKSADKMVREFVFVFDEQFEKSVVKKLEQKLDTLFKEHKDFVDFSIKNKKQNTSITWKISGDIDKVDALCEEIFGIGYSDISYYCQDRFILNRQYNYKEIIDLRPIFDWEYSGNIDYTLKMTGKVNEENTLVTGGLGAAADISGKKVSYLCTESGYLDARVMGSTVNKTLVTIIALFVVLGLKTAFAVVVFVYGKGKHTKISKTGNHREKKKKKSR